MRIAFVDSYSIKEVQNISLVPAQKDDKKDLFIFMNDDYFGEYIITDEESYQAALRNYNEVSDKLLIQGFCYSTDFENFEIY